jgi:hypothetical protein
MAVNETMPWEDPPIEGASAESAEVSVLIKIAPNADTAAIAIHAEGVRLLEYAVNRVIDGTISAQAAADDLSLIAKLKKSMTEKGKEYTDPINAHLKAVREAVKELMEPFDQADQITRSKLLAYRQEEEHKRREVEEINRLRFEAAQREAELNNGEITETAEQIPVPYVPATVKGAMGTAGTAKIWKWECTDQTQVPEQYKILDAGRVRKVIEAGGTIPGIRSWQEETIRVTAR